MPLSMPSPNTRGIAMTLAMLNGVAVSTPSAIVNSAAAVMGASTNNASSALRSVRDRTIHTLTKAMPMAI